MLWTYVSPAGDYDANGARTGKYVLGGDNMILNSQNESYISYADLAIAIIDELKKRRFRAQALYRRRREDVSLKFRVI